MTPLTASLGRMTVRARAGIEGPDRLPIAWTLRGYDRTHLPGDIAAGMTVAALTVPLSIGYAAVAGLPPEVGLYASMAPLLAYALLGSARRLVVGPDASTAALIAATIVPLAATMDDRVRLAGTLGILVALVFLAMRLARLGFFADFLSRPILLGYLTGVGVTVAVGQVDKMLGGPAIAAAMGVLGRIDWSTADPSAVADAIGIAVRGSGADVASAMLGIGVAAVMLLGRRFLPGVPMALVAMIVALALSAGLDLQSHGVQVLGPVPSGLPPLRLPFASLGELLGLIPGALGLAMLSFADTAATGRTFAARSCERTDADRELIALAAADAAGALSSGYPISSSASRTAAAEGAGSASQATGLFAMAAVGVVLLLLTEPLSYLPTPALGGVIFVSVLGLIDVRGIVAVARLQRSEGAIAVCAAAGVIAYGTLIGVLIAVLLAALNIVRRAAAPQVVELWRMADGSWRDPSRNPGGTLADGVAVVRLAGPLFFANAATLEAAVRRLLLDRPATRAVILDLAPTPDVDVTAGGVLRTLADAMSREGRRLAVARPLGPVRDELRRYGLADLLEPGGGSRTDVDAMVEHLAQSAGTAEPAPGSACNE